MEIEYRLLFLHSPKPRRSDRMRDTPVLSLSLFAGHYVEDYFVRLFHTRGSYRGEVTDTQIDIVVDDTLHARDAPVLYRQHG